MTPLNDTVHICPEEEDLQEASCSKEKWTCAECGEVFEEKAKQVVHRVRKHKRYTSVAEYEREVRRQHAEVNLRTPPNAFARTRYRFLCPQCEKVYDTRKLLRQHYQRSHYTQRFECDSCQLRFALKRELRYHQRTVHVTEEKRAHRKRKQAAVQYEEPNAPQRILHVSVQQCRQIKEKRGPTSHYRPIAPRNNKVTTSTQTESEPLVFTVTQSVQSNLEHHLQPMVVYDVGTQYYTREVDAAAQANLPSVETLAGPSYATIGTSCSPPAFEYPDEVAFSAVATMTMRESFLFLREKLLFAAWAMDDMCTQTDTAHADRYIDQFLEDSHVD